MTDIDVVLMGITFALVMFIIVATYDKLAKIWARRRQQRIIDSINWPN